MTTKEQILNFFVSWEGPERNSLRPFRGMTYREEFVRGRGDAPEGEGEESVRRQLHGGAKRRQKTAAKKEGCDGRQCSGTEHGGGARKRCAEEVRGRRPRGTGERLRRGEAKRDGRTGGCGRRCIGAEHGCSWRGHGEGYKKRAAEELNLPPLTLIGAASTDRESGAGGRVGGRMAESKVRAGGRMPGAGAGAGGRSRGQEAGAGGRVPSAGRRMPEQKTDAGRRAPQAKSAA